eukprot:7899742-Lingulodinium_polyedra.AAC.1
MVFAWNGWGVRCANRRNGRRPIQPHHCARFKTVHNDAVESTVCNHNGAQIARLTHSMRTPVSVFAWNARLRFASRFG